MLFSMSCWRTASFALPLVLVACGPAPLVVTPHRQYPVPTSEDCGEYLVPSLLAPEADRSAHYKALVRCQVTEASLSASHRKMDRALLQLQGASASARAGDFEWPLSEAAEPAYTAVVAHLAQQGDTGRAGALYSLLARVPKHSASALEHLSAIETWAEGVEGASNEPIDRAQGLARVAFRRRMFDPSKRTSEAALAAVRAWLREGLTQRDRFRETRIVPTKEVSIAMQQALAFAPLWLLALHAIDGAPYDVLDDLQKLDARDILNTSFATIAESTRPGSATVEAWFQLYRVFSALAAPDSEEAEAIAPEDRDLYAFVRFRAIQEAYRLAPEHPQVALSLARDAQEFGLGDATPFILRDAIAADSPAQVVSFAASLNMRALSNEAEHSHARARRMFAAMKPLLNIVDKRGAASNIVPSAGAMRAWMAGIELRDGYVDQARTLLEAAIATSPEPLSLFALARVEWRDGKRAAAIGHFQQASRSPAFAADPISRAEAFYYAAEVTAESGDAALARTRYVDALRTALGARTSLDGHALSRAERLVARLLLRFGEDKGARRAYRRAFEAAGRNRADVEATTAEVVGRALLAGDIDAAREGISRALSADVEGSEAAHYALWGRLIERQRNLPTSAAVERVLKSAADQHGWVGQIARFGLGKTTSEALITAAKTPVEYAEALFYHGIDLQITGDAAAARAHFEQVVRGEGVSLNEWGLAREYLLSDRSIARGALPNDITVP